VFDRVDKSFLELANENQWSSGAACILALIQGRKLTIANLGDCVATLISKDGRLNKLSVEQTVSRPDENLRIVRAGGNVFQNKLNGQLDVSRSFGNRDLK